MKTGLKKWNNKVTFYNIRTKTFSKYLLFVYDEDPNHSTAITYERLSLVSAFRVAFGYRVLKQRK